MRTKYELILENRALKQLQRKADYITNYADILKDYVQVVANEEEEHRDLGLTLCSDINNLCEEMQEMLGTMLVCNESLVECR